MLDEKLRHGHSGLAGDGQKVRWADIDGKPKQFTSFHVGSFTVSAPGTVYAIANGFKPKSVQVMAVAAAYPKASSNGFSDGTYHACQWVEGTTGNAGIETDNYAAKLRDSVAGDVFLGYVTSFDADGFTFGVPTCSTPVTCVYRTEA